MYVIKLNGMTSESFDVKNSVRQGDQFFALLFNATLEVVIRMIAASRL